MPSKSAPAIPKAIPPVRNAIITVLVIPPTPASLLAVMKACAPFVSLMFLLPSCQKPAEKHGPSLGFVENVTIIDTTTRNPDDPDAFKLNQEQAADFLNSARIVSGKEIHDFYNVGDDSYSGTATISGMTVKWTITNGGTGSITREFDGETYRIADPKQRDGKNLEN